jgi:uncharacterized protein YlxW (UPF0749 family)
MGHLRALLRHRLPLVVVAVLLGILAVGQFRGQAGVPGLADLSVQELGVLVANLNDQNDQLRAEVATLQRQQADLASTKDRGQSAVDQLQSDLARIRAWAGLTGLAGSGVTITIHGPIGADGVEDLVNELRNAGAEAVQLEGTGVDGRITAVRVIASTSLADESDGISVDGTQLVAPYRFVVVGDPGTLAGAMAIPGGVEDAVRQQGGETQVTRSARVRVGALRALTTPRYARPQ